MLAHLAAAVTLIFAGFASCAPPELEFDGAQPLADAGDEQAVIVDSGSDADVVVVVDHCLNRAKDADESDVDCGGLDCDVCALGQVCATAEDCVNGACTAAKCQDPTCTDQIKNKAETDVDCGGIECGPCAPNQACVEPTDCSSQVCSGGRCEEPACDDHIKNGNEVDIDCAGDCEKGCEVDQACVLDGDCVMPPDPDTESISCEGGICTLSCGAGKADCDSSAANGCETFTNDDIDNCGGCMQPCAPADATGQCSGGSCEVAGCDPGFENCNGEHDDGCEVNLNSDPLHCGSCANVCSTLNGTAGCSGGTCTIACATGYDDCDDNVDNGCEVNVDISALHCGGCSNGNGQYSAGIDCPNGSGQQSPYCADGSCGLTTCSVSGTGDCDGDGNSTDDLTSTSNCGACGSSCVVNHNSPVCSNSGGPYACAIGTCDQNGTNKWADCNTNPSDGCERDLFNDKNYCGTCGNDCNTKVGTQFVTGVGCNGAGSCVVTSCSAGYADCDGVFSNGCEVQKATDNEDCGGCVATGGVNCTTLYPHAPGTCSGGACSMGTCNTNWGNCSGGVADGCETDLLTSKNNCSACGIVCQTDSVTSVNNCVSGTCTPTCTGAGQECDSDKKNGCEDKNNDSSNCGSCNTACQTNTGTTLNVCNGSGVCSPTCLNSNYQNCDSNPTNGCENKLTNDSHCGVCNRACDETAAAHVTVTGNNCSSGVCVPNCATGYSDCDSMPWNGCEAGTTGDATHCGSCTVQCGGDGTNVQSATCGSSTCSVTCTVASNKCPDTSDPEKPCTQSLGTTSNCLSCGQVCSGGTPLCTPSGCNDHYPIIVESATDADGKAGPDTLSFSHALQNGTGKYRAVVVGVAATMNPGNTVSVTYNGTPMVQAIFQLDNDGQQSAAGIWYLLDASLPAAAGTYSIVVTKTGGWGGMVANALEMRDVAQTGTLDHAPTTKTLAADCTAGDKDLTQLVSVTGEDTVIYAVTAVREGNPVSGTPSNLTELNDNYQDAHCSGMMGFKANVSTDQTVGWTGLTACWTRTLASVTFNSRTN